MMGASLVAIETSHDVNNTAKGVLAEQFIGQHLMYHKPVFEAPSIHYWKRQKQPTTAEVNYLAPWSQRVSPVEVKSKQKGHMKSLQQQFSTEKQNDIVLRFSARTLMLEEYEYPGRTQRYQFLNIPNYLNG